MATADEALVELPDGRLRGYRNGEIFVFKGVPYADTTAGPNRFRAPQPVKPWDGTRDATRYGPSSPQARVPISHPDTAPAGIPPMTTLLGWGTDSEQGEDCLVLNVWTPALGDGDKRPVMVRIHGGGYTIGSGSWPQSDGAALARLGDVVVVTVNHRLGALGYLYLAEIGGERYANSGNAGLLDLVAALGWVRDNVARFGGDPGNVTIFGESGGGLKVSALLAMPAARNLFHKAIVQSGPGLKARMPDTATAAAEKALGKLGIGAADLDALHRLPAERFLLWEMGMGGPVLDGRALSSHPGDAIASGTASAIPLLIGTDHTESTLLAHLSELPTVAALDEAGLRTRLEPMVSGSLDRVIEGYRRAYPGVSSGDLLLYVESDRMFRANTVKMAEQKIKGSTAPVFMYLFAWRGEALGGLLKASHGLEVPFTMHNPEVASAVSDTPGSRALVERMSAAWIAFAHSGDPNVPSLPRWDPYTEARRATMLFDTECKLESDPFGERAVWDQLAVLDL